MAQSLIVYDRATVFQGGSIWRTLYHVQVFLRDGWLSLSGYDVGTQHPDHHRSMQFSQAETLSITPWHVVLKAKSLGDDGSDSLLDVIVGIEHHLQPNAETPVDGGIRSLVGAQ